MYLNIDKKKISRSVVLFDASEGLDVDINKKLLFTKFSKELAYMDRLLNMETNHLGLNFFNQSVSVINNIIKNPPTKGGEYNTSTQQAFDFLKQDTMQDEQVKAKKQVKQARKKSNMVGLENQMAFDFDRNQEFEDEMQADFNDLKSMDAYYSLPKQNTIALSCVFTISKHLTKKENVFKTIQDIRKANILNDIVKKSKINRTMKSDDFYKIGQMFFSFFEQKYENELSDTNIKNSVLFVPKSYQMEKQTFAFPKDAFFMDVNDFYAQYNDSRKVIYSLDNYKDDNTTVDKDYFTNDIERAYWYYVNQKHEGFLDWAKYKDTKVLDFTKYPSQTLVKPDSTSQKLLIDKIFGGLANIVFHARSNSLNFYSIFRHERDDLQLKKMELVKEKAKIAKKESNRPQQDFLFGDSSNVEKYNEEIKDIEIEIKKLEQKKISTVQQDKQDFFSSLEKFLVEREPLEMIKCKSGSFLSNPYAHKNLGCEPIFESIENDFWLSSTTISEALWLAVMGAYPRYHLPLNDSNITFKSDFHYLDSIENELDIDANYIWHTLQTSMVVDDSPIKDKNISNFNKPSIEDVESLYSFPNTVDYFVNKNNENRSIAFTNIDLDTNGYYKFSNLDTPIRGFAPNVSDLELLVIFCNRLSKLYGFEPYYKITRTRDEKKLFRVERSMSSGNDIISLTQPTLEKRNQALNSLLKQLNEDEKAKKSLFIQKGFYSDGIKKQYTNRDMAIVYTLQIEVNDQSNGFRLPTDLEWQYAATTSESTCFSGIDDICNVLNPFSNLANCEIVVNKHRTSNITTTLKTQIFCNFSIDEFICQNLMPNPIGYGLPNAWGFKNMTGNIWELCIDNQYLKKHSEITTNALVCKGGAFNSFFWQKNDFKNKRNAYLSNSTLMNMLKNDKTIDRIDSDLVILLMHEDLYLVIFHYLIPCFANEISIIYTNPFYQSSSLSNTKRHISNDFFEYEFNFKKAKESLKDVEKMISNSIGVSKHNFSSSINQMFKKLAMNKKQYYKYKSTEAIQRHNYRKANEESQREQHDRDWVKLNANQNIDTLYHVVGNPNKQFSSSVMDGSLVSVPVNFQADNNNLNSKFVGFRVARNIPKK